MTLDTLTRNGFLPHANEELWQLFSWPSKQAWLDAGSPSTPPPSTKPAAFGAPGLAPSAPLPPPAYKEPAGPPAPAAQVSGLSAGANAAPANSVTLAQSAPAPAANATAGFTGPGLAYTPPPSETLLQRYGDLLGVHHPAQPPRIIPATPGVVNQAANYVSNNVPVVGPALGSGIRAAGNPVNLGLMGAGAPLELGLKPVLGALGREAAANFLMGSSGAASSEGAKALGAPQIVQTGAGLAGGFLPGLAKGGIKGVVSNITKGQAGEGAATDIPGLAESAAMTPEELKATTAASSAATRKTGTQLKAEAQSLGLSTVDKNGRALSNAKLIENIDRYNLGKTAAANPATSGPLADLTAEMGHPPGVTPTLPSTAAAPENVLPMTQRAPQDYMATPEGGLQNVTPATGLSGEKLPLPPTRGAQGGLIPAATNVTRQIEGPQRIPLWERAGAQATTPTVGASAAATPEELAAAQAGLRAPRAGIDPNARPPLPIEGVASMDQAMQQARASLGTPAPFDTTLGEGALPAPQPFGGGQAGLDLGSAPQPDLLQARTDFTGVEKPPANPLTLSQQRLERGLQESGSNLGEGAPPAKPPSGGLGQATFGPQWEPGQSLPKKALNFAIDAFNAPRGLLASLDYSYPLRQGWLAMRHGKEWGEAFGAGLKAWTNDAYANETLARLASQDRGTLQITGLGQDLSAREEQFLSRWINKVPGVRRSQQAATVFINKLRADVYDNVTNSWVKRGVSFSQKDSDTLGNYINAMTGRGNLGHFENASTDLATAMFSPRLFVGRIQAPLYMFNSSALVRQEAIKDFLTVFGTTGALLALGHQAGAFDLNLNPTSSDFGKIRVGDTRIDPWGGYQQMARFVAQIATGSTTNLSGVTHKQDIGQTIWNFMRSKAAPGPSFLIDAKTGKSFTGEDINLAPASVKQQFYEHFMPLFWQDMITAIKDEGVKGGLLTTPEFFGSGGYTIPNSGATSGGSHSNPYRGSGGGSSGGGTHVNPYR